MYTIDHKLKTKIRVFVDINSEEITFVAEILIKLLIKFRDFRYECVTCGHILTTTVLQIERFKSYLYDLSIK